MRPTHSPPTPAVKGKGENRKHIKEKKKLESDREIEWSNGTWDRADRTSRCQEGTSSNTRSPELRSTSIALCIKYAEIYLSGFPYSVGAANIERLAKEIEQFHAGNIFTTVGRGGERTGWNRGWKLRHVGYTRFTVTKNIPNTRFTEIYENVCERRNFSILDPVFSKIFMHVFWRTLG